MKMFKRKREDINQKEYEFKDDMDDIFTIMPNYTDGYKQEEDDDIILVDISSDIDIEQGMCSSLTIAQAKEVIKSLKEIVDFVENN